MRQYITVSRGSGPTANAILLPATAVIGAADSSWVFRSGSGLLPCCNTIRRIRPETRLGEDVHVGNFVEVKASRIGNGSKANHLAYIGDSEVGRNVNVGAGTITCNYDGANKHRTVIEDDVHIGSGCQLVAPIKVHRGATLGAGTTLTRDAPADALTVSRVPQVSRAGWRRPRKK